MTDLRSESPAEVVPQRSAGLLQALDVVERGTFRGSGLARCVPSAGAIFPYDLAVLVRSTKAEPAKLFRLDLARRAAVLLPISGVDLERSMSVPEPSIGPVAADVVVLTRPWLSMRKYGQRGYLYAQLDAGHAATNLLGTALDHGTAMLRLRVPRGALLAQLREHLPYREVHSVVSIGVGAPVSAQSSWSSLRHRSPSASEDRRDLERYCWSGIPSWLVESDSEPADLVDAPLAGLPSTPLAGPIRRGEWQGLAHRRRSCKQFSDQAPPPHALAGMLDVLATSLPTDLPNLTGRGWADGVRTTFAVASGRLAESCRELVARTGINMVVSDRLGDPDVIRRACMGQQHLTRANAFVLCHVGRRLLLADADGQALRDAVFRAASVVQLLYLGATRSGVAVTAIGGQDVAIWRHLVDLPGDEELLYLLALGSDQSGTPKYDRAELAHAHGE